MLCASGLSRRPYAVLATLSILRRCTMHSTLTPIHLPGTIESPCKATNLARRLGQNLILSRLESHIYESHLSQVACLMLMHCGLGWRRSRSLAENLRLCLMTSIGPEAQEPDASRMQTRADMGCAMQLIPQDSKETDSVVPNLYRKDRPAQLSCLRSGAAVYIK